MRPANGRAASSPGTVIGPSAERVNGRVLSGLVSAAPRATPCAGAAPVGPPAFFDGERKGTCRARRRVSGPGRRAWLVLLGDPTSLKDVSDPHCCAWPQRCSCLCRRLRRPRRVLRHGPAASCSAAMAPTARFQSPDVLGCLPGHRDRLARRDSIGLDQGPLLGPVVPRGASEGPAKRRPAALDGRAAGAYGPARGASVDPPLTPGMRPHGEPVPAGCIPPCDRRCSRHRDRVAPGRRHPQAMAAAPLPDSRRLSGSPRSDRRWLPTHRLLAAPGRCGVYAWHQGGTRKKLLAALAPLAARPP